MRNDIIDRQKIDELWAWMRVEVLDPLEEALVDFCGTELLVPGASGMGLQGTSSFPPSLPSLPSSLLRFLLS